MVEFGSFLTLVVIGVIINRVMAWGRRADARNRARFIAMGYRENFPSFRLRQDQRKRIAFVAWLLFAGLPMLFSSQNPFRQINPFALLLTDFVGLVGAVVPAMLIYYAHFQYVERTNEKGLYVVNMLVKQFHKPIEELVEDGSFGTAELKTAEQVGLINLQGMAVKGYRPIVPGDKPKDGEK